MLVGCAKCDPARPVLSELVRENNGKRGEMGIRTSCQHFGSLFLTTVIILFNAFGYSASAEDAVPSAAPPKAEEGKADEGNILTEIMVTAARRRNEDVQQLPRSDCAERSVARSQPDHQRLFHKLHITKIHPVKELI
jgi:hypothetical protein